MKKIYTYFFLLVSGLSPLKAQNYIVNIVGNPQDTITLPQRGTCLLGGGQDNVDAMKWFLTRADHGDVLVLNIGNTGNYSDILFSQIGVQVHSVETIMFQDPTAAYESYIHQKIDSAEAIFITDGNLGDPIAYWRNTPIDSLIRAAVNIRKVPLLGIGVAASYLGNYYFSGENGDISSDAAMFNPYASEVVLSSLPFIWHPSSDGLKNAIVDAAMDNPDKKGKLTTFMARMYTDNQLFVNGIGLDEGTAVCIDEFKMAYISGNAPGSDDNVYFVRQNCELQSIGPEVCASGAPLVWKRDQKALSVCHFSAGAELDQSFDLSDWLTSNGGFWEYWYVENGVFGRAPGVQPNCNGTAGLNQMDDETLFEIFPNPANEQLTIIVNAEKKVSLVDVYGKTIFDELSSGQLDISTLDSGSYFVMISGDKLSAKKLMIVR